MDSVKQVQKGAVPKNIQGPSEVMRQYLAFTLGHETYAIEVAVLKEIIPFGGLTEIPLMPAVIRGVINLRGAVVPVVDLAVRFGRPPQDPQHRACIVVLEVAGPSGRVELGVMVDSVNEVLELGDSLIEPPPRFGNAIDAEFISGIGRVGDGFIILLDVSRALSPDELACLDTSGAKACLEDPPPAS